MFEYYLYYPNYKLHDYEADLAQKEVFAITGEIPQKVKGGLKLASQYPLNKTVLQRLTFFHRIEERNGSLHWDDITYQMVLENTAKLARKADSPRHLIDMDWQIRQPINGRKESQHITHGIHDYKGKFYPQLVKSLLNYLGAKEGDRVLDPFMGSGTTILECHLANIIGIGVDLNPLAYLISEAKVICLALTPVIVTEECEGLLQRIHEARSRIFAEEVPLTLPEVKFDLEISALQQTEKELLTLCKHFAPLPYTHEDLEYLFSWFAPRILLKLFLVLGEIERMRNAPLQVLCRVLLSDIIRDCSQQDPHDLRIRRRRTPLNNAPVFELFHERLLETAKQLVAFLATRELCGIYNAEWECHYGDTRNLKALHSRYLSHDNSIDLAVTSPPYATALPYLDTDRLSLAFLRLADQHKRRQLEDEMIGNREILLRTRAQLEQEFLGHYDECLLPAEVKQCIRKIYELNAAANVGFRRKNMAALLYKYFEDMRLSMSEVYRVLKPGAKFALIVGNNITTAGDERVEILTDRYLELIGESLGMRLIEKLHISVTTEDLAHIKNSIRDNTLLILEK